jgi:hypothetical protein
MQSRGDNFIRYSKAVRILRIYVRILPTAVLPCHYTDF